MPLDGDNHCGLEDLQFPEMLPGQAAARESLDVRSGLVQAAEALPGEHPDDAPLDRNSRPVALQHAAHEEAPAMALNDLRVLVHPLPPHVVRPPVRLDHRGADPRDGHPLRIILAVLIPGSPRPLNALGRQELGMRRLPGRSLDSPLPLQVRLHTISVRRGVEDARPPHYPRSPGRALHGAVGAEVVGGGAHAGMAIPFSIDDVHQCLRVVVQRLAQRRLLQQLLRLLRLETEGAHVVRFRQGRVVVLHLAKRHQSERLRPQVCRQVVWLQPLFRGILRIWLQGLYLEHLPGLRLSGSRGASQSLRGEVGPERLFGLHPVDGLGTHRAPAHHQVPGRARLLCRHVQVRQHHTALSAVGLRCPPDRTPRLGALGLRVPGLLKHRFAVLPQGDGERVGFAEKALCNLVARLKGRRCLVPLLQVLALCRHVVVGDRKHSVVILLHHGV
mmetsp:Transcript_32714/g.73875  ORF Transcript_32714/g.73875 Transcript_32714/m.73875 type:complete len:445 (-) Transcript_32714:552-1886(-)